MNSHPCAWTNCQKQGHASQSAFPSDDHSSSAIVAPISATRAHTRGGGAIRESSHCPPVIITNKTAFHSHVGIHVSFLRILAIYVTAGHQSFLRSYCIGEAAIHVGHQVLSIPLPSASWLVEHGKEQIPVTVKSLRFYHHLLLQCDLAHTDKISVQSIWGLGVQVLLKYAELSTLLTGPTWPWGLLPSHAPGHRPWAP